MRQVDVREPGGWIRHSNPFFMKTGPWCSVPCHYCLHPSCLHSAVVFFSLNRPFVVFFWWHFWPLVVRVLNESWLACGPLEKHKENVPSLQWSHCGFQQCTNWRRQLSTTNTQVQFAHSSIQITGKWVRPCTRSSHTHSHGPARTTAILINRAQLPNIRSHPFSQFMLGVKGDSYCEDDGWTKEWIVQLVWKFLQKIFPLGRLLFLFFRKKIWLQYCFDSQ